MEESLLHTTKKIRSYKPLYVFECVINYRNNALGQHVNFEKKRVNEKIYTLCVMAQ